MVFVIYEIAEIIHRREAFYLCQKRKRCGCTLHLHTFNSQDSKTHKCTRDNVLEQLGIFETMAFRELPSELYWNCS